MYEVGQDDSKADRFSGLEEKRMAYGLASLTEAHEAEGYEALTRIMRADYQNQEADKRFAT